jgi:glutathione peroxidase
MAGLQVLEEEFSAQGFHVLGFYSNDFGNQGGNDGQIDTCTMDYGITFEQFVMGKVKPPNAQPVWQWLLSQPDPGPAASLEPNWNFNKYLVSRSGELVAHWATSEYWPENPADPAFATSDVVAAITAELAK